MIYILVAFLVLAANIANAGSASFSWIPNSESKLAKYEIYCDPVKNSARGGNSHSLWKNCDKDNIIDGRVHCTIDDFPDTLQYCVVVAIDNEVVSSDFSEEIMVNLSYVEKRKLISPSNFKSPSYSYPDNDNCEPMDVVYH